MKQRPEALQPKKPTRRKLLWQAPQLTALLAAAALPASAQSGYQQTNVIPRWWDWSGPGSWRSLGR